MVKNPHCNAGDTGSIPDPERFHMPWGNYAAAPQLLSPHVATTESHMPKSLCSTTATTKEATTKSLYTVTRESPHPATKTQSSQN